MIRWAALVFPSFPGERALRSAPDADVRPLALSARDGAREIVVAVSPAAAAQGVRVGRSVAAARAFCAGLEVRPHDPAADRRALEALAQALGRYTPDVALDPPHGLLLEIGRTSARFGGEEATLRAALDLCAAAGFTASAGVAGGAAAARVLARAAALAARPGVGNRGLVLRADGDAARALSPLPWSALAPDADAAAACVALGLRTVGDVLRLPRAALPARFGQPFSDALAAALGERAEPVARYLPPPGFAERLELWRPVEDSGPLLFAATRLFAAAEAALDARESGAAEARLRFELVGAPPYDVVLRPTAPAAAAATFVRLLQHRLERAAPPAPVEAITLALPPAAWAPLRAVARMLFDTSAELGASAEFGASPEFGASAEDADAAADLRDRLATRLGRERVLRATLVDDHRPERAFAVLAHGEPDPPAPAAPARPAAGSRPLELRYPPAPADVVADADGAPTLLRDEDEGDAPLRVVRGPERVAAGWWDGADADRAYFEVETSRGLRLWLFRDLAHGGFFRHGEFS